MLKELVGGNGIRGMVGIIGVGIIGVGIIGIVGIDGEIIGKIGCDGKIGVIVERVKIDGSM